MPCSPGGPPSRWSTSSPTPTWPGSRNEKRWQDVEELLDAGIDVISTVNVQHLESLKDVVERITGVRQQETVPDWVVRQAEQVELVDMTPEAIRRRMAHGNIYGPDRVDAAMSNYFRPGNLAALRELALLWMADNVDDSLQQYMEDHGIDGDLGDTRACRGRPHRRALVRRHLIRRAARMAQRSHGDLLGVHVRSGDGLTEAGDELLEAHRQLLTDLGGKYHEVVGNDVAAALAGIARIGEGDPARPRGQSPEPLVGADQRVGHQQGDPPVGRDRRARDLL